MTRTELQAALKYYRTQTYFLRCKLNAKTTELQAEYDRIQELDTRTVYEEKTESEVTEIKETYKGYTISNQPDGTVYITADCKPEQYVQTSNRQAAIEYIDLMLPTDTEETNSEYIATHDYKGYEVIEYTDKVIFFDAKKYLDFAKGSNNRKIILNNLCECRLHLNALKQTEEIIRYQDSLWKVMLSLEVAQKLTPELKEKVMKLDFNFESEPIETVAKGVYCDVLDSPVYKGKSCYTGIKYRSYYLFSRYNDTIGYDFEPLIVNDYEAWIPWNQSIEELV